MTWTLSTKSHENWQKLIFFGQFLAEYGQCAMQWFGIPFQGPENCVHPRDSLSDCINRFRNATKWRAIWAIAQWSRVVLTLAISSYFFLKIQSSSSSIFYQISSSSVEKKIYLMFLIITLHSIRSKELRQFNIYKMHSTNFNLEF